MMTKQRSGYFPSVTPRSPYQRLLLGRTMLTGASLETADASFAGGLNGKFFLSFVPEQMALTYSMQQLMRAITEIQSVKRDN